MALAAEDDLEWMLGDDVTPEQIVALVESYPPAEREALWERIEALEPPRPPWEPLPHQRHPNIEERWHGWLLMGGRGVGKTAAVCHAMDEHANGPACFPGRVPHRMGIIAPTFGDASASIVHGVDGLVTINPDVKEVTQKGGTVAKWPNGAFAFLFGVHTLSDVDRLRAKGNRCFDVREELAAWRYLREGVAQADLGLRSGPHPRWVGATTPRPRPTIRKLSTSSIVCLSTAETDDNPYLPEEIRHQLYEQYGNTRLGLQELKGLILEEVTGALWAQELIEQHRVSAEEVPALLRVRTYVDPSWGTTHDECGIIVAGISRHRHVYVLADLSRRVTPMEWGQLAALGYMPTHDDLHQRDEDGNYVPPEPREYYGRRSERVVGEGNFQAEQVRLVMRSTSRELGIRIPFGLVFASKGKRLRAEPVHQLYEQGKVHHVGHLAQLEFQLTNWVPPEHDDAGDPGDPEYTAGAEGEEPSTWSPDRLDAVVFAATDLLLGANAGTGKVEVADGRIPKQKVERSSQTSRPRVGSIPPSTRQGRIISEQLGGRRVRPEDMR